MKRKRKQKGGISISMDNEIRKLQSLFSEVEDHRASNCSHKLRDILMCGYAMFSLKHSSLLSFENQNEIEKGNLQDIFGISKICSDSQTRLVLDKVSPEFIRTYFSSKFKELDEVGLLKEYEYRIGSKKYLICSNDGVQHFSSNSICCDKCLEKKHKDGSCTYCHQMLCSALVHPDKREVFIMDAEPIVNGDGHTKNDCELNAGKRMVKKLKKQYGGYQTAYNFIMVEDALYANGPHIEELSDKGFNYLINIKPDSHKTLFRQIEGRRKRGGLYSRGFKEKEEHHYFEYSNNVRLNDSSEVRCNYLRYTRTDKKGKKTTFTWVTNIKINKSRLIPLIKVGRSRWKIENETFNTLKNLGYHFGHNFGHGKGHLSTMFAYLMLLAFHIDQFVQSRCHIFKAIEQGIYAKKKLWESMKSVFHTLKCKSVDFIYRTIAALFLIQLE